MYIYHVLISALSAHMIHKLNTIFYTYIEHSPAKTFTYHMETHTHTHTHTMTVAETDWVLILVGVEIL